MILWLLFTFVKSHADCCCTLYYCLAPLQRLIKSSQTQLVHMWMNLLHISKISFKHLTHRPTAGFVKWTVSEKEGNNFCFSVFCTWTIILQVIIRAHHEWISSSALHPSYWQTHYPKRNKKNSNIFIWFEKYHLLNVTFFSNSTSLHLKKLFFLIVFCFSSTALSRVNSNRVVCDPWSKSKSELYCHLSHVNVCKETNYKSPGSHIVQMAGSDIESKYTQTKIQNLNTISNCMVSLQ